MLAVAAVEEILVAEAVTGQAVLGSVVVQVPVAVLVPVVVLVPAVDVRLLVAVLVAAVGEPAAPAPAVPVLFVALAVVVLVPAAEEQVEMPVALG